jgi:hypothetical protein
MTGQIAGLKATASLSVVKSILNIFYPFRFYFFDFFQGSGSQRQKLQH